MANRRNYDVEVLTVQGTRWVDGQKVEILKEEQHEQQFLLRRMWALQMLHWMRWQMGWNWDQVASNTGKTRQTWNGIAGSRYLSEKEYKKKRNTITVGRANEAYKAEFRQYRPVSDTFIRKVTETLRLLDYSINTPAFRYCFDNGMTVFDQNPLCAVKPEEEAVLLKRLGVNGKQIVNIDEIGDVHTVVRIADTDDWEVIDGFPMIARDSTIGNLLTHDYVRAFEIARYGYVDEETAEPDPRAHFAHDEWKRQREWLENEQSKVDLIATDPGRSDFDTVQWYHPQTGEVKAVPPKPLIEVPIEKKVKFDEARAKSTQGETFTITADDGEPATKDLGGFFVQLPRTEVHPGMINADRQVAFNVVIQLDENNKVVGSVTMHNPKGGFSVNG